MKVGFKLSDGQYLQVNGVKGLDISIDESSLVSWNFPEEYFEMAIQHQRKKNEESDEQD